MLFLPAATPCSPDWTRKTRASRAVERPHPPWGGGGGPEGTSVPLILTSLHSCLTTQLFPARATPDPARATPSALSPGPGIPGHLPPPALPAAGTPSFPEREAAKRVASQAGDAPRRRPAASGLGSSPCTALRLGRVRHSPPGCSGPLRRAGAAGRRRASGPTGTWRGGNERCLREGAAETGREAARGGEGPAGAPVRRLFRSCPAPVQGLPLAPLGPPLPALPAAGCSGPGPKLNTLGPAPPGLPGSLRVTERRAGGPRFLLRLGQTRAAGERGPGCGRLRLDSSPLEPREIDTFSAVCPGFARRIYQPKPGPGPSGWESGSQKQTGLCV